MAYVGEDADIVKAQIDAERARKAAWWASLTPEQQEAERVRIRAEAEEWARLHPPDDGGFLSKLLDWAPAIMAAVAVVATAGAAAGVLGAAGSAGAAAGAAGTAAGAAGATAAGTAAAGVLGAEVIAGIPAVFISAAAPTAAAGISAGTLAGIGAGAIGAGAILSGSGGAGAGAGAIDPNIPTVNVNAPRLPPVAPPPLNPLGPIAVGGAAGVGLPGSTPPHTVEVTGQRPPPQDPAQLPPTPVGLGAEPIHTVEVTAPRPPQDVPYPSSDLPPVVVPALAGMPAIDLPLTRPSPMNPNNPSGLPRLPNLPDLDGIGDVLGPALIGGALADLLGGQHDVPTDPSVGGAIGKLNQQGNSLMADWQNWMYPQLKSALADHKSEVDSFVASSRNNESRLIGLGNRQEDAGIRALERHHNVYVPQADRIIADANAFSKNNYAEQQAGIAIGDMSAAYDADRKANAQRMSQYGISPTSGRAMALDRSSGIQNTANVASAANRARMAAEEIWGKKQMDAMGTASILNQNLTTFADLNQGAGNLYSAANNVRKQGVDARSQYFSNANDLAKTQNDTYGTANQAFTNAGNLGLGKSKLDNDRYIAEQQGRGQVIGAGLSALTGGQGLSGAVKNVGDGLESIVNVGKTIWDWF